MTPGVNGITIDGMSSQRIAKLIESLKDRSYQPNPARRTYIAKKNNPAKKRPLGIPSGDDKLVQEVIRMLLESIYEPNFSDASHGFRPQKSCHTALTKIQKTFTGAKWFVEGDIKACFDSFDHHVPVSYTHLDVYKRQGQSQCGTRTAGTGTLHRPFLCCRGHSEARCAGHQGIQFL